ncbi:hypothetical protein [Thalassobacillus hwangdonensis]|uniref:Protein-export membrane protein SecG n=1 Tax=Thalassobacillus hwangdonensis TaxID=546108 RepID=A0ABW3KZ61_9BACI
MYPILIGIIILVSIIALIGTLYVGKDVNQTIKKYEQNGDSGSSLTTYKGKSSITVLSVIYLITLIVTIALVAVFIF